MTRQHKGLAYAASTLALVFALGTAAEALSLGGGGGSRGSSRGGSSAASGGGGGIGASIGGRRGGGVRAGIGRTSSGGLGAGASIGGRSGVNAGVSVGGNDGASLSNGVGVSIGGANTLSVGGADTAKSRALTSAEVRFLEGQTRSPDVNVRLRAQRLLNANADLLSGEGNGSIARIKAGALDDNVRARASIGTGETDSVDVEVGDAANANVTLRSGRAAATAPAAEANIGVLSRSSLVAPSSANLSIGGGDDDGGGLAAASFGIGGGGDDGAGGAADTGPTESTGPTASGGNGAEDNAATAGGPGDFFKSLTPSQRRMLMKMCGPDLICD